MRHINRKVYLTSAALALVLAPLPAIAQESDAASDTQELRVAKIVVTSRKVEEDLQSAPLAVTAFGAAEIQDAGLANIEDIALLTPGLTFAPLFGGAGSIPVIRGQSTSIGESNVGFFVDGVYQSSRAAMDALLAGNIERVEVVKGPQSALYGRNTFAGAINYITRKPSRNLEGGVETTLGDYGLREVRGNISVPMIEDQLYFRGGASHYRRDGYFDNELTGDDLDSRETNVLSASFEATPSASLGAVLRIAYEKTSNGDSPLRFLENNAAPGNPTPAPLPPAFQLYAGEMLASGSGYSVSPGGFDRKNTSVSLAVDKEFDSGLTLTSITGYVELETEQNVDNDYEARSIRYSRATADLAEFSQELRLASSPDGSLRWMVGAYYYDLSSDGRISDTFVDGAFVLAQALSVTPLAGLLPAGAITTNDETTTSYALFGSLSYDLTDRLTGTFEGRWTSETKDIVATQQSPLSPAIGVFTDSAEFENFVPKFILDYQYSDDLMVYLSAAKATKTGGFNIDVTGSGILPSERIYDPEESWTYEGGFKSTLADGRMTLNGAVYHIQWTDQIVRALGATFATLNANAGETSITGVELETRARLARGLDLTAGYAYTDSAYDKYTFGALAGLGLDPVLDGKPLQWVSEHQFNLSLQYQKPAFGNWEWMARGDLAYFSDQSTVQTADAYVGDTTLVNLRTGLSNDDLSVSFWVRNLFEEDTAVTGVFLPNQASRFDTANGLATPAPVVGFEAFNGLVTARDPRAWGVTLRKSF